MGQDRKVSGSGPEMMHPQTPSKVAGDQSESAYQGPYFQNTGTTI